MTIKDLKDYKLVWSDEFDGNELDPKKWVLQPMMGTSHRADGSLVYDLATDEKVIKVEDSLLKLNVYFDYERNTFVGPVSPCTKDSMSFKYGYVEMRARVPYSHGSWASFWTIGRDAINQDKTLPYFSEFDIFEINGTNHCAVANLHKWHKHQPPFWTEGKPANDAMETTISNGAGNDKNRYGRYSPENPEDFHTYGFYWTPEIVETYIDGDMYAHFDITENFGRESGMAGFRQPQFFIMNNYLLVDNGKSARMKDVHATPEDVETQVPYEIDYIRLYQKEGQGELNLAETEE